MNVYFGIAVSTYNRIDNLKQLLASLEAQSYMHFHISIVDGSSTDGTSEFIYQLKKTDFWRNRLRYINCPPFNCFAAAYKRNLAVKNLPKVCNYLIIFDSDIIIAEDYLAIIADEVIKNFGCILINKVYWLPQLDNYQILNIKNFQDLISLVPHGIPKQVEGTFIGEDLRFQLESNPFNEVDVTRFNGEWCLLCNLVLPISMFNEVGGLDEDMKGYGYEDVEFGRRLEINDYLCKVLPDVYVLHIWHPKKDSIRNYYENQFNLHYVLCKHGVFGQQEELADWAIWWHYEKMRGGMIIKHDDGYYAINRKRSHCLELPNSEWVARLGHDIENIQEDSIKGMRHMGLAKYISTIHSNGGE